MFGSDAVSTQKTPRKCHKSLKWVWHPSNLLGSLIRFPTKWLVKIRFWEFSDRFMVMFLFTILTPQKPHKKSSQLFGKSVASDKCTFPVWNTCSGFWQNCDLSLFCHICQYLWGYVPFYHFGTPQTTQKIIIDLWKRCGIRQVYFHCLKYMLRVLTKLWFKFFLSHLWIPLR